LTADAIKRTAFQRACEVHEFKVNCDRDKLPSTPEAIAAAYSEAARIKKHIDVSWIRMCLTVYEKICTNRDIAAVIDRLESKYGTDSCLNSLTKLVKIIEKCDLVSQRVLVFHALEDSLERGIYPNSKFTREFLIGGASGGNCVPFVPMVIFKWRLRTHLLTVEMPREKMDPKDTLKISEMTADYVAYRKNVDVDNNPAADTTWIGAMNPSSVAALRVIQEPWVQIQSFQIREQVIRLNSNFH
jgi:hypothetical protein